MIIFMRLPIIPFDPPEIWPRIHNSDDCLLRNLPVEGTIIYILQKLMFTLRQLLRSSDANLSLQSELPEDAAREIHDTIIRTAEAYNEAAHLSPTSSFAAYHARFLWHLIHMHRARPGVMKDRSHHDISLDHSIQSMVSLDSRLLSLTATASGEQESPSQTTPSPHGVPRNSSSHHVNYPITSPQEGYSPNVNGVIYGPTARSGPVSYPPPTGPPIYTPADHVYYRAMLFDLGFGGEDHHVPPTSDGMHSAYSDGMTTHYTQYPYGSTQPLGQAGFVGS